VQRWVRLIVAGVAATTLVVACSSGNAAEDDDLGVQPIEDSEPPDDDSPSPPPDDASREPDTDADSEVPDEPEPDPEPDPFAVPDEIDAAYVDLVMNELLAVQSAALHDILISEPGDELTPEDASRIAAVTSGPHFLRVGEDYLEYSVDEESRGNLLPPEELGEITWTTRRIMEASSECIVAIGYYDLAEIAVEPYSEDLFVMASLAPAPHDNDSVDTFNTTPWRLHDLNLLWVDEVPIPEEDWERVNYAATLEMTCDETDLP